MCSADAFLMSQAQSTLEAPGGGSVSDWNSENGRASFVICLLKTVLTRYTKYIKKQTNKERVDLFRRGLRPGCCLLGSALHSLIRSAGCEWSQEVPDPFGIPKMLSKLQYQA